MSEKTQNKPVSEILVQDPEQAPVTNEELLQLHASQGEVIARQEKEIEVMRQALLELSKRNDAPSAAKSKGVLVTVNKVEYKVVHGIVHQGRRLSAPEIAADKKLCADLVAAGSTALQEQ